MNVDPWDVEVTEIVNLVTLIREPWPAGRIRSELLRADPDERVTVRTDDGKQEFTVTGRQRWYDPQARRFVTTLTVTDHDPNADLICLTAVPTAADEADG